MHKLLFLEICYWSFVKLISVIKIRSRRWRWRNHFSFAREHKRRLFSLFHLFKVWKIRWISIIFLRNLLGLNYLCIISLILFINQLNVLFYNLLNRLIVNFILIFLGSIHLKVIWWVLVTLHWLYLIRLDCMVWNDSLYQNFFIFLEILF